MKQLVTEGIVLARTNYQEADRILTVLTPEQGKLRLIAKGVRKPKSKLAGGIELFSINQVTYIQGKSELRTLISARSTKLYNNIVKDINRTMFGYEILKRINRMTDEVVEPEHFILLDTSLQALDDDRVSLEILEAWFDLQLLKLMGQQPNLLTDTSGAKLVSGQNYTFSVDDMTFALADVGPYDERFIKLLRLAFSVDNPQRLLLVKDLSKLSEPVCKLVQLMARQYLPTGAA
jgi:DNA repair protein RecO